MNNELILKEFEDAKAILKGHFILSSGMHSDTYLQCARVLSYPKRAEKLSRMLADKIMVTLPNITFDMVVAPAMGGVIIGYEMGRQLNLPSIFCERVDGEFTLRRGFTIPEGSKILVVEDVITTGKSSLETFACIQKYGGEIVAEACLVDRGNQLDLGVPLISLIKLQVNIFTPDNIPDNLKDVEAIKPGSRFLNQPI